MNRQQPRSTLFPYTTLFRSSFVDSMVINLRDKADFLSIESTVDAITVKGGDDNDTIDVGKLGGSLGDIRRFDRSEEHTSELQSRRDLVCRLLLEKKN